MVFLYNMSLLGNEYEDLLMNGKDHIIPMFDEHPEDIYYEPKSKSYLNSIL